MQPHVYKSFLLLLSSPFCLKIEVQFERMDRRVFVSKQKLQFQIYSWPHLSLTVSLLCKYQMEALRIFRIYCWCRSLYLLDALDMIFQKFVALGFYWSSSYSLYLGFQRSYPKPETFNSSFFNMFICTLQTQNAWRDTVLSDRHNVFILIHQCCIFFR